MGRSTPAWKLAHDLLYHEDGTPTERLLRMRETAAGKAPNPGRGKFPLIRVSERAQELMHSVKDTAFALGSVPESNKEGVKACYSNNMTAMRALFKYVERLEHALGITRDTSQRF